MTAVQNGEVIPTLVTTKDKTKHAALRRPITGAFAMSTLVKYEPYVDDVIKLFMTQLDERFASGFGDPTVCEMDKFVQYCKSRQNHGTFVFYSQTYPSCFRCDWRTHLRPFFWILEIWSRY